ncbi:MAG: 3-methyl-2-oxobutanoate hydroxymethyltransferase [Porticoccaceae bacterium]|jgi:3-methyl-2-oxobutanoate hydroxymethyltransferase|nr:3-methyl-2-oxobutanoate hydroxymethyltransferase [Porticoccaceae bacterium]
MSLSKKVTVRSLKLGKSKGEKFAMITSYDATFARLSEEAGIECLLVGDSLGNVVQGQDSTLPVTIEDMCYHTSCVAKGVNRALIVADMPFMSYSSPELAFDNAAALMQSGAHMVKMEGGAWVAGTIALLTERGIPVCAHMGLLPQSVNKIGGYRLHGKTKTEAKKMLAETKLLEEAGADLMLLEMVPAQLAGQITQKLKVPVIGIGAGNQTDAQVLVCYDLLGVSGYIPRFANNFLHSNNGSIQEALAAYATAVKNGSFPDEAHTPG